MKIEIADINTIKPYENNPRKLKDSAIEKVAMSLKEYGFRQPIVVDKDRIIVVGHTRYRASKKLGFKEVPITIADNLTPEQINAYRIADNRTAEESEWDNELLKMEIKDLEAKDFKLDLLGFNEDQLNDMLFEEKQGLTDEDEIPEAPEEPISKLGDIWKLGNHKLICGDSTILNNYEKLFNENKADLLMTDPPYNVDYEGKTKDKLTIQNDSKNDDDFLQFLTDAFNNCAIHLKLGCSFYIFHSDWYGLEFRQSIKNSDLELKQNLIWAKNSMVMGRQDYQWQHEPCLYGWKRGASHSWYSDRKQTTIIKYDRPSKSKLHPTMKPVGLVEYLIKNSSKQEDIVLDPFLGSGTTLIACEKQSRICYGIELDPKYCDVIVKRWEQFTGKKAELENGQK
jgi:site-specific DNA-methyltransferase (adenine-specific)